MALVKTTKISSNKSKTATPVAKMAPSPTAKPTVRNRTGASKATITERVAAATEQLSSGITQSSAAAEELRRSMEQIASGAEEAAGASQEQLAAIKRIIANLGNARSRAGDTLRQTEAVQVVLAETSQLIANSVRAIERNAERQNGSLDITAELERRASEIADITRIVSGISDQTNLLALNAAIEAARAGDHGRGFAVVAEEVRALAETSEKSAKGIQSQADAIQKEIRQVAAAVKTAADTALHESKNGLELSRQLEARRTDMVVIANGSEEILGTAMQAERAATEAQRGAELVASAAEQQSAAATEAQTAIQEQSQALEQSQTAAQALAAQSEKLRAGNAGASAAEEISSSAEELSASVQEMSGAATEIMAAISQISKGSQQQAAATQQTSAALAQIEKSAQLAKGNAQAAVEKAAALEKALREGRTSASKLIDGVTASLTTTKTSVGTIRRLELVGRTIEKIVDTISLVAVQTTMLAVSGSVEAARAGDAGRGFAVVSSDIRSLARDTSNNVDRIKDTVRSILDQIALLRRDLEHVIASNDLEIQSNLTVSASLERLESDITSLMISNNEIMQGADAILSAVQETAAGAQQIASAAEEASSAVSQASTASSQQARGAEDLAASIEEIASLAQELK
ncbi:MAG TPA: methyl-accepting chemotaxis protein [Rhizomicrobium sp.]|jgi:methyl-accepting chemotaxis protein